MSFHTTFLLQWFQIAVSRLTVTKTLSPLSILWNGQNYDFHGEFSTGKMALSPCKHWRIWQLAGSWAELDAIKADRSTERITEIGVHQRHRGHG